MDPHPHDAHAQQDFMRAVGGAASSLREAFDHWWPQEGDNEVAERMPTMHLGAQLQALGCHLYPEATVRHPYPEATVGESREHVDLIALRPELPVAIAVEAKRLYSSEQAPALKEAMVCDALRIRRSDDPRYEWHWLLYAMGRIEHCVFEP